MTENVIYKWADPVSSWTSLTVMSPGIKTPVDNVFTSVVIYRVKEWEMSTVSYGNYMLILSSSFYQHFVE